MLAHVISHFPSDHPLLAQLTRSLDYYGWRWRITAATQRPSQADWDRLGVKMIADRGKLVYRPGAQGCWHSHFKLWLECRDRGEPMVILEHDVLAQGPWTAEIAQSGAVIKLYKSAPVKTNVVTGQWSKGSQAYYLTPSSALQLIDHARCHGAEALDKHLGDRVVLWRFWSEDLFTLNPQRGTSTTSR